VPIPEVPEDADGGPEFEITGDTRSLKHAGDPDADVVVPYEAIESVMDEADDEHSTLKNVVELVARVSSKGASGRFDAPHHAELWTPRQEDIIPEQQSEETGLGKNSKGDASTEPATATSGSLDDAVQEFKSDSKKDMV